MTVPTIRRTFSIGATSAVAATTVTVTKVIAMTTLQKTVIATAIVVAAGAGIYQARQSSQLRQANEVLEEKRADLALQVNALQRERDDTSNRLVLASAGAPKPEQKSSEVLKLRGQVGTLQQTLSDMSATNARSGLAKMMSDPAMRDYIHQVQAKIIKERYEPLMKELKMTPENAEKFTQAIGDIWAKGTDAASGGGGETTMQNVKEAVQKANQELQSLLGESGFTRYNEYNMEIPARTTIKLLDGRLGDNQLNDNQTAQLIKVVMAEPFELTHGISGDWDNAYFGSQADFDEHMQKVQESQQRILQQASSFLNSNQLSTLGNIQTESISARKTQAAAFVQKH